MIDRHDTDALLLHWAAGLFAQPVEARAAEPSARGRPLPDPAAVREQIRVLVQPGALQVMVKISGGGRGMNAIAAHMRYISRQGKPQAGGRGRTLMLEDEGGHAIQGRQGLEELRFDWRMAGSYIPDASTRREAFNIVLSMPRGTPPEAVRDAARAFARETFDGHKYVFVLHEDTGSPHVHLTVRAEGRDGVRLDPRKADLAAWRVRFASRLQDRGVKAVASRASMRAGGVKSQRLWRARAQRAGNDTGAGRGTGTHAQPLHERALAAWQALAATLAGSERGDDRRLAREVRRFLRESFGDGPARAGGSGQPGR